MAKLVLGSGLVAVDHIFLASALKESRSTFDYLGSAGGGTIANALCLMSLLGYKTHVFSLVGTDLGERIVKEDFRLFKVNYDNLLQRGNQLDFRFTRQYSHIIFRDGKHKFKTNCLRCDSEFEREYQISDKDVTKKTIDIAEKTDLLMLDRANEATLMLANSVKQKGGKIAYDLSFTSFGKSRKTLDTILKLSNLVKINHKTFLKLCGSSENTAIIEWREKYPETDYLLVTNGENGSYGYGNINGKKEIFRRDAIKCDYTKDAAGSGDIFFGITASKLLLDQGLQPTFEDFIHAVDFAQALASLNCTLYGARALQRVFLNQRLSPKEIFETAQTIIERKSSGNSFSPTIGLPKPITEPYRLINFGICKICGAIPPKKKTDMQTKVAQTKISNYSQRSFDSLARIPWTMQSGFEIGKTYRPLASDINLSKALIIGSGGSFTAAAFTEALYLHSWGKLAKAITPYEFEGLNKIEEDVTVWFISHGGGNTDILGAALHAKNLGHSNCAILTGNKTSKLAEIAQQTGWKTFFIQAEERNFVSIIGLLSQVSALCGLFAPEQELAKLDEFFSENSLRTIVNSATREMSELASAFSSGAGNFDKIHIVSSARGWGWPALIDLESKVVEGGLCTIEICELKNFTHGRYINLFGHTNRSIIIIKTPKDKELVDYLYSRFEKRFKTFILETDKEGVAGSLDLLVKSLFLSWHLGNMAKKDILHPIFPKEARGLYSWEPSYRKGYWKK
jgi:sugar/nucleoside kinase (ribokinase family)/fructoselysine-6-P-deglycase FrlB-like protein